MSAEPLSKLNRCESSIWLSPPLTEWVQAFCGTGWQDELLANGWSRSTMTIYSTPPVLRRSWLARLTARLSIRGFAAIRRMRR